MLKLVNHPNIIRMEGLYESRTYLYIVMEMLTGGELFERIVGRPRYNLNAILHILYSCVSVCLSDLWSVCLSVCCCVYLSVRLYVRCYVYICSSVSLSVLCVIAHISWEKAFLLPNPSSAVLVIYQILLFVCWLNHNWRNFGSLLSYIYCYSSTYSSYSTYQTNLKTKGCLRIDNLNTPSKYDDNNL